MALLERQITSSTHDFQPPHELRPGRVGDKYLLDLAATVDLAPSQHEGVCLRYACLFFFGLFFALPG